MEKQGKRTSRILRSSTWHGTRRPLFTRLLLFLWLATTPAVLAIVATEGTASATAAAVDPATEPPRAAVTLDGKVLFYVRGGSAHPAEQRARAIGERIRAIAADPSVSPDSLLVFTGKLFQEKVRGTLEYGALATSEGLQFERKWLKRSGSLDESVLEVSDFSATTDLYQVVSNVYDMGVIPLDLRNLLLLILSTLLPFVPVLLMALPFDVILQELAGLLL